MKKRLILAAPSVIVALVILIVSIYRTTGASYVFSASANEMSATESAQIIEVAYDLPEDMEVTPESIFWAMKVFNDKTELLVTLNPAEKAKALVQFADERLVVGFDYIENEEFEKGIHSLTKAEYYLESALKVLKTQDGEDITQAALLVNSASLKHREILEKTLILSPDDARPHANLILDKTKVIYSESRVYLEAHNSQALPNPFDAN